MAWDGFNGTFDILSVVSDSATQAVIRVSNSSAFGSDFDETGADARAGVFTDALALDGSPNWIPGDLVRSSSLLASSDLTVISVSGVTVTLSGVTAETMLPDGVQLFVERTTRLVPLRDSAGTATTTNLVRGDMLAVDDLAREIRVVSVNADDDNDVVSISGDGTTATMVLTANHHFSLGQRFLLVGTGPGNYDGVHVVTSVPLHDTLEFASTATTSLAAGRIVGLTVELDEELTVLDGTLGATTLEVVGRWLPIELPTATGDLVSYVLPQLLRANGFTDQPKLRSNTIADSMFFTNGDDEVFKFDGENVYRAGLFRWQPQLFVAVDTTTGSITLDATQVSCSARSGNKFTVDLGQAQFLTAGTRIQDSADSAVYTVQHVSDNGTNDFVYVVETISSAAVNGHLSVMSRYHYYYRLQAIDANQNVVVSAVTGATDCIVDMTTAAQIKHRLTGMPAFTGYDFDRIELQMFRTRRNTSGPFYLIRTVPVSFNAADTYIDITDGTPDDSLRDFDTVSTALLGSELGTAWDQPQRAKFVTTSGNRLILSHVKSYPELDITLRRTSDSASLAATDLVGKIWRFRKDHAETSTVSNLTSVQGYEFVGTSGAVSFTPATDLTNNAGASFTVDKGSAHGLNVGDWVYLYHSAAGTTKKLTYAGWWKVASRTTNRFTITFSHGSTYVPSADDVNRYVKATAHGDVPVLLGADYNLNWVGLANPSVSYEVPAMMRLASAINVSMRACSTPWLTANAGSEYAGGQMVVRQPAVFDTTGEVVIPVISGTDRFQVFVNGILRTTSEEVSTQELSFPSRTLASYENYPEIFDAPTASANASDSAIDVDAANGQETQNAMPFFGTSSFGTGQVEGKLIVLKTNSLHQVDLKTRQVQPIEQPYGGCAAPDSVTQTKSGINFANASGIYRINRDLTVDPIGDIEKRRWLDDVNLDALAEAQGHNYLNGNQYKLSVPVGDTDQLFNNYVFVFDYAGMQQRSAWTRHDNHLATGWCNIGGKTSLFATQDGQVYKIREALDTTDYRDDADAISVDIMLRPEDFDLPGVIKNVGGVRLNFANNGQAVRSVSVSVAANLSETFQACDPMDITTSSRKEEGVWFSLPKRKCEVVQVRVQTSTLDAPITLSGVAYYVAALDHKGAKEVAQVSS
jgi:hypothetical protein